MCSNCVSPGQFGKMGAKMTHYPLPDGSTSVKAKERRKNIKIVDAPSMDGKSTMHIPAVLKRQGD